MNIAVGPAFFIWGTFGRLAIIGGTHEMGNNTDRPVGQRGYIGNVFYPHRPVVGCLEWLLYGERNIAAHLPEIFRALHPSYLANDLWLNSAWQFGPRFYYTQGILSRQISFRFR